GVFAAIINTLGAVTSTMSFFPLSQHPFPGVNDVKLDRNDNIYIVGGLNDTVVIAPTTTLFPTPSAMLPGSFAGNSLIARINSNGTLGWYQRGYTNTVDVLSRCAL